MCAHVPICCVFFFFSTGVGRTGCFVALSTIIERMRCEGLLDVFMTVKNVRTHRPFMVRTLVSLMLFPSDHDAV